MPNLLITRAIAHLSIPGIWGKGGRYSAYMNWDKQDCVATSLTHTDLDENLIGDARDRLYQTIGGAKTDGTITKWAAIIDWNDRPERTLENVLTMMHEANKL